MAWYWYVLIAVALVGLIVLKVRVGAAWMRRQRAKKEQREKRMEDED